MKTTVTVSIDPKKIAASLGLRSGGAVGSAAQKHFTESVARHADKYVPFQSGGLKNNREYINDHTAIKYVAPQAKFLYYGKVMVDPNTGSTWARRGVRKVLTVKDIRYRHAPRRGAFWERRMWADEGETVVRELKKFILTRPGGR